MRPLVADRRYVAKADDAEDATDDDVPAFEPGYVSHGGRGLLRMRQYTRHMPPEVWPEDDPAKREPIVYHNWNPERSRQSQNHSVPFPPFPPELEPPAEPEFEPSRRTESVLGSSFESSAPAFRELIRGGRNYEPGSASGRMSKSGVSESRRDPAPSRWAYRMQRIMLTPYLRALLRVGVPCLVLLLAGAIYIADDTRRGELVAKFEQIRQDFQQRPEFMVNSITVEGTSPELGEAVVARLGLTLPRSSFDIDLPALALELEALDAIKSVDMRVRSGELVVGVIEREPVVVWRHALGLTLLDETGHRVAGLVSRGDRPDLPLVVGDGAEAAMADVRDIVAALGPLTPRMRGLVRVGERRWDLILDRDQKLMLPEKNPARAIERLLALDKAQDILARDLLAVDLRLPHRPTLRLTRDALNELRRAKGLAIVEIDL